MERSIEPYARPRNAHIFVRDPYDFYVEPEWCSERLFDVEKFEGPVHDPACGIGRIVSSAIKAGHLASGSDIAHRSSLRDFEHDYLDTSGGAFAYPNIVCNPPFRHQVEFIDRARIEAIKVAMLLPARFLWGLERSNWLRCTGPRRAWLLCPRPSMPPGEVILRGERPCGGKEDYCWVIWERGYNGFAQMDWLRRNDS